MAFLKRGTLAAALLVCALWTESSHAQEEEPVDTVYFTNGGFVRGRIVELIPEDHVTIMVTGTGETKTIPWKEIRKVSADVPAGAVNRAPPPRPTPAHIEEPPGPPRPPAPASWRPHPPTFIGGAIAFGAAYGITALIAIPSLLNGTLRFLDGRSNLRAGGVQLFVPFLGPFLFAGNQPNDEILNEGGRGISDSFRDVLYVSGAVQIIGGAGMITGLVLGGRPEPAKKGMPKLEVAPLVGQGTLGLTVGAYQW